MEKKTKLAKQDRNILLEFEEAQSGDNASGLSCAARRSCSDRSRSEETFKYHETLFPAYKFRGELKPDEEQQEHEEHEKHEEHEEHQENRGQKKKRNRPNKTRRNEFRQYVDTLKEQLEQDPERFDCRKIKHPPRLICNEQDVERVVGILERHRLGFLVQGALSASISSSIHAGVPSEQWDHQKVCLISL